MSEREEVLREFTTKPCPLTRDGVVRMMVDLDAIADEIVRLRFLLEILGSELNDSNEEAELQLDRAERMARVVDAVRDYFNDAPNDNGLYSAWTAYTLATSNVRALDAEAQP